MRFPKYRVVRDKKSDYYFAEKRALLVLWFPLKVFSYKHLAQKYCEYLAKEDKPLYLYKDGTWGK